MILIISFLISNFAWSQSFAVVQMNIDSIEVCNLDDDSCGLVKISELAEVTSSEDFDQIISNKVVPNLLMNVLRIKRSAATDTKALPVYSQEELMAKGDGGGVIIDGG